MWPYLVAYEVRNSNGIEPILEERLLAMNGRKLMDRLWLVVADEGASYVLSRISPDLSTSDQILVLEMAEDVAAFNVRSLAD